MSNTASSILTKFPTNNVLNSPQAITNVLVCRLKT